MINVFIARQGSSFTAVVEDSELDKLARALKSDSSDVLRLTGTDGELFLVRTPDIVTIAHLPDEEVERRRKEVEARQQLDPRRGGLVGLKGGESPS